MKNSKISWTHHTFNPWMGCTKISPGCRNCYACTMMDTRYGRVQLGNGGTRQRTSVQYWRQPLRWNTEAEEASVRHRVFAASLADVFEKRDELIPWRDELHDLIRATPCLDWLLLTKRPEVAADYYRWHDMPNNVWLGTSVENQDTADRRVPILANIAAKIRFLSCEPLLAEIANIDLSRISWLIAGGESGPRCRPMKPEWVRTLRDQCQAADTPFFFKQWGGLRPKTNGNILDGVVHEAFPISTGMSRPWGLFRNHEIKA